jgi:ornithine cyclodeaminase/alanine dehydrogenase-like protein (mu-crystallin family)
VRYFTESDVRRLLPMGECVRLMRRVFEDLATGKARNQPRRRLTLPTGAVLHSMAGAFGDYFGTKIYSTHPAHGAHFHFVLYRAADGVPLALFEANFLGQIRTGAVSGLATDLLARADARTLAVVGTGFQARSQVEAVLAVRRIERVRVWGRSHERRLDFASECSAAFGVPVEAAGSAGEAVAGADIVVTATNSREPVIDADWVAPGAHVNAIGSNQATRRELPSALIGRAGLIAVDSREQARIESGDLLMALDDSGWNDPRIVELQEVAAGAVGRPSPESITIFKSNGLAVEDVAAAAHVYTAEPRGAEIGYS